MPSGKIHSALTLATASGVLAPYLIVQFDGNPYWYVAGCVVGILVSPDMDVDKGNISDQIIRKISRPAQWLWRLFWTPYALLVPHRHFISHFPIFGTVLRVGYIFLIINLLNFLIRFIAYNLDDTVSFVWLWNWSFFFGLCHVDAIHFVVDKTIKGRETFEDA
jgi:uncharacterized metal-binding protein